MNGLDFASDLNNLGWITALAFDVVMHVFAFQSYVLQERLFLSYLALIKAKVLASRERLPNYFARGPRNCVRTRFFGTVRPLNVVKEVNGWIKVVLARTLERQSIVCCSF